MKKIILLSIVTMVSLTTFAQRETGIITIQPRFGLCTSFVQGEGYNYEEPTRRLGFVAGADIEYFISRNLSIQAGLLYSQQGLKFGHYDVVYKFDYVNVPIVANYYVWKGLAIKVGLQPGFKVSVGPYGSSPKIAREEDVKDVNLGIPVGLSYDFGNLVVDLRMICGLTNVFTDLPYNTRDQVGQLTLGYKIHL